MNEKKLCLEMILSKYININGNCKSALVYLFNATERVTGQAKKCGISQTIQKQLNIEKDSLVECFMFRDSFDDDDAKNK